MLVGTRSARFVRSAMYERCVGRIRGHDGWIDGSVQRNELVVVGLVEDVEMEVEVGDVEG